MKKYDCWFCDCGRIQVMPDDYYDWMAEDYQHRRVIRICQNCGATRIVWLDTYMEGFAVNSTDFRNEEIQTNGEIEYRIIMNDGIKVPMMNGGYADTHYGCTYINWSYLEKDLGTTYLPAAKEDDPNCTKVDVQRLIRENDPEVIKSISGYLVGIDWTGTPYEWK